MRSTKPKSKRTTDADRRRRVKLYQIAECIRVEGDFKRGMALAQEYGLLDNRERDDERE